MENCGVETAPKWFAAVFSICTIPWLSLSLCPEYKGVLATYRYSTCRRLRLYPYYLIRIMPAKGIVKHGILLHTTHLSYSFIRFLNI